MTRNEFYLACLLVFLILGGIAYLDRVGGGGSIQPVLIEGQGGDADNRAAPAVLPPVTSVVNINRATADELEAIPGIDRERAENIIAFRDRYGLFSDLRELMEVPGIGRNDYEQLRAFVRLADLAPLVSQEQTNTEEAQYSQASSPLIREGGKAPVRVGSPRLPGPIRAQPRTGHGAELPDLNRATTTDLKAIDGIGDVLARRILEARARRGGFRTWRDVEAVEGIGASRLRAIQQKFSIRER